MNLPETWRHAAKIKTFILSFSYNSFQNVVRVLPTFFNWLRRCDPSLSNSLTHSLTRNIRQVPHSDFFFHTRFSTRKTKRTHFFLRNQNGFQGAKTTPEKCGAKYPFNCFTYNNRILHNQTYLSNVLTVRDEKCDFVNLIKKIFEG